MNNVRDMIQYDLETPAWAAIYRDAIVKVAKPLQISADITADNIEVMCASVKIQLKMNKKYA